MPFGNEHGGSPEEAYEVDGNNATRSWCGDIVGLLVYLDGRQTGQRHALRVHRSLLQGLQAENMNSF